MTPPLKRYVTIIPSSVASTSLDGVWLWQKLSAAVSIDSNNRNILMVKLYSYLISFVIIGIKLPKYSNPK